MNDNPGKPAARGATIGFRPNLGVGVFSFLVWIAVGFMPARLARFFKSGLRIVVDASLLKRRVDAPPGSRRPEDETCDEKRIGEVERMDKNRYEIAFEHYLRSLRLPFLANRQERRFLLQNGSTLKNFDYIVSSASGENWIVDVKGRRFPGGAQSTKYWKNWTTRGDLTGLLRWENILSVDGDQYIDRSAFVFAYWTLGPKFPAPQERLFIDKGVPYAFFVVSVKEYLAEAKFISPRWGTFEIPAKRFQEIAVPADEFFGARTGNKTNAPGFND